MGIETNFKSESSPVALPGVVYFGNIRPLRINAKQASQALGAPKRSKTLQRLIHAALTGVTKQDGSPWLILVQRGGKGRRTLIDTASFEEAYAAMLRGEQPPLFPSELKRVARQFPKESLRLP